MNECKALHDLFQALDLDFVEQALERSYGRKRTGRHPRSLLGQFKTELLKRVARIENYDELHRLLQNEEDLRLLCDIKEGEKPYHPSILSRFRKRIGPEAFQQIMAHCVKQLDRIGVLDARTVALDATFIKAYSRRDPEDTRRGFSDVEARLRKQGRNVTLGYGVHLAVDVVRGLVIGFVVVPANRNEKRVLPHLLIRLVMTGFHIKTLIADTQYSSNLIRILCSLCKITAIIPYPKNQFKHVKGLLRVDRLFRAHGPKKQVKLYHKRSANERGNAWLKGFYGLEQLRTRGLENATIHVTLCVMASYIIAIAALKHKRPDLIRSPTLPHQIYTQKLKLQ
ncbi:transposase [Candidatus Bathyarchaeota archaeon]|nr:transposase [Candidatus Bathyarchaeota archaeon]